MKRNRKWKILHSFKETNLVPQPIVESQIKSKTVMTYSSRKKKKYIFCTVYFVRRQFYLRFVFYLNVSSTLSEYTNFYISTNITSYTFVACF